MTKRYYVTLRTAHGSLTIDDIEARDISEAISVAEDEAQKSLDCAKIGEVYCYG